MYARSTEGSHHGRALVVGVDSSHAVRLIGGSTGGSVEAFGDDANISLNLRGKGTGAVRIGNSSSPVVMAGGSLTLGSGVNIKGAFAQTSTYSHAAINPNRKVELTFASTTVDISSRSLLSIGLNVATADLSSNIAVASWRTSTVATSRLTVELANITSTATSTGSGSLQLAWIDLS